MPRDIHFVFPRHVDEHLADFFAKECCIMIEKLTKFSALADREHFLVAYPEAVAAEMNRVPVSSSRS